MKRQSQWAQILQGLEMLVGPEGGKLALDKIKDLTQKGKDAINSGPKIDDMVAKKRQTFTDLANRIQSLGCTDPTFTDPTKLFNYFTENAPITREADLFEIVSAIVKFLGAARAGGVVRLDPNIVNDIFKYIFEYHKRYGYNKSETLKQLDDLTRKAVDPFQDGYVVATITENFALASAFALMTSLDKPQEALQQMMDISNAAVKMLGKPSAELLDYWGLQQQKSRTMFDYLSQSDKQFTLLTPMALEKQKFIQSFYSKLETLYGSDVAKTLVTDPAIRSIFVVGGGILQGLQGIKAGGAEALNRGKS